MSLAELSCLAGTLYLFYLSVKILKFVLGIVHTTFADSVDFTSFGEWAGEDGL